MAMGEMTGTKGKLRSGERRDAVRALRLAARRQRPTAAQLAYLRRGLDQPEGRLPLFDRRGQRYNERTIQSCLEQGWIEPCFDDPIGSDWTICRLTRRGAALAGNGTGGTKGQQAN